MSEPIKYLVDIDLNKNYLRKARFENLAEHPSEPAESQVYYNTTDKCYYYYEIIDNVGSWVSFVNSRQLAALLDEKQDVLTAGEGIDISVNQQGETVISVTNTNTIYEKTFVPTDFTNNVLSIPANEHNCGTSPTLDTVMLTSGTNHQEVDVGYSYDASGNVSIEAKGGFTGFVRLSSAYHDTAALEPALTNILYGSVSP